MSEPNTEFMDDQDRIYVVGHQNPDTDSICSAIGYAYLKNESDPEHRGLYGARRAGQINRETEYVLKRFGVEEPKLLANVRQQVKNVDYHHVEGIKGSTSIKDAWALMRKEKIKTLPVTRDGRLEGVITMGDITTSYMDVYDSRVLFHARTQYRNIASVINGKVVNGNEYGYLLEGKISVGASSPEIMKEFIEENDLVILGNREEAQQCAVDSNVSCMVVCQGVEVSETIRRQAEEKEIVIIISPYDTFTVARLINQSIPVRHFMTKKNIVSFQKWDYVEAAKEVMTRNKFSDFPVLEPDGTFLGFISRRRLLNAHQKKVILMDHNEKSQAVDGIEEAEIVEIIDHHKLGCMETLGPVYFRNQPVGCTSTIVYQMYQEKGVEIPPQIAGLLCAAILSDTLLFRSPTCTPADEEAARSLAEIAGIQVEEFAQQMFKEGSNLKGKSPEEITFMDFKLFNTAGVSFGVGQVTFLSEEELQEVKASLQDYLEQAREKQGLDMLFMMLTNIITETTDLVCVGKDARETAVTAFHLEESVSRLELRGIVSRKKQLIPSLVSVMQQTEG